MAHDEETEMTNNQLVSIVERIEKLEDDRALLTADVKEIYSEAKSNGFDPKIIKKIIAMRKKDAEEREREEDLLQSYMAALGMLADTPLGEAAMARAKERF
jgi:uncharacterized protein (UPF0335 family)